MREAGEVHGVRELTADEGRAILERAKARSPRAQATVGYVVIYTGTPSKDAFGPFPTREAADAYGHERFAVGNYRVSPIYRP